MKKHKTNKIKIVLGIILPLTVVIVVGLIMAFNPGVKIDAKGPSSMTKTEIFNTPSTGNNYENKGPIIRTISLQNNYFMENSVSLSHKICLKRTGRSYYDELRYNLYIDGDNIGYSTGLTKIKVKPGETKIVTIKPLIRGSISTYDNVEESYIFESTEESFRSRSCSWLMSQNMDDAILIKVVG